MVSYRFGSLAPRSLRPICYTFCMTKISTPPTEANAREQVIRIGLRALAEYVHRTGGLSSAGFSDLSAVDGTRAHQRFFAAFTEQAGADFVQTEVTLEGTYRQGEVSLLVSGRADLVVRESAEHGGRHRMIEAKTVSGPLEAVPEGGDGVHWAQAMMYACLFSRAHPEAPVERVSLFYLSADAQETRSFDRRVQVDDLESFFGKTCAAYLGWATDLLHYRLTRDRSALGLRFPYTHVRAGQKPFMRQVLASIRENTAMLIQAPTGIGKTISALYPAAKAIAHHLVQNVFYLTAKASTRQAAEQAMQEMRESGLVMKSITLYAKESLCPVPAMYCDTKQCPYATGYFDRIHPALARLMALPCVRREDLLTVAESYQVCPFELSLDFSMYCDIVICDYNYVFDPRVRLVRYFEDSLDVRRLLLVDEAHNLPDRSREMFSAELTGPSFTAMSEALLGLEEGLDKAILGLQRYFGTLSAGLATSDPAIDQLEEGVPPAGVLVADNFRATRQTPARLQSLLWRFLRRCDAGWLDTLPAGNAKRAAKNFFFDTLFFLRVVEEFYDPTYVTTYTLQSGHVVVRLMCLDASARLASIYRGRFATVFFSATLSPMRYFERMLSGRGTQGSLVSMVLPSPFPPENLLVCLAGAIGTRYRQRQETAWQVASAIDAATSQKTGNYLVFLSSFAYLRQIQACYLEQMRRKSTPAPTVIAQTPGMSETGRQRFLDHFSRFGKNTLVAFAVLGGVFGEGIDLVGDRLSGVVIVGTGLPLFCPEREIMREYYQNTMDGGFEYSYMYPGFNKVQQAAGRVIRSEEDRGFVVLIDDRYLRPEYTEIVPEEWNTKIVNNDDELAEAIQTFG